MKKGMILMFHVINNPPWFEKILNLLKANTSLVDMSYFTQEADVVKGKIPCHLTFDDGDKSFYEVAYPLLMKHRVPATLYVSPTIVTTSRNFWFQEIEDYRQEILGEILSGELNIHPKTMATFDLICVMKCLTLEGITRVIDRYQQVTATKPKSPRNMNAMQLIEVKKSNLVTIGAHTLHHPILRNESDEQSAFEITASVNRLQELLQDRVERFAYPNGIPNLDFGSREILCLKKNNVVSAVSTDNRVVVDSDDPLCLPRMGISRWDSALDIKLKLLFGMNWKSLKALTQPTEASLRKKVYAVLSCQV